MSASRSTCSQQPTPVQVATPRRRRFQAFAAALTLVGTLLTLPVSPVSAANEPNTPSLSFVTATSNSVRVNWTAPATNGAPITRYELRRGATLVSAAITASTFTYTNSGLSSGTAYDFTLKACSSGGCSTASSVLTAATLPAAATNVTGVAGEGSVTVTWTDSPASALTGHKVLYKLPADASWTEWTPGELDLSPTLVTGLTNAGSYTFKVAAYNTSGETDSKISRTVIPRTVPNAPVISTSSVSNVGVGLTWTAPNGNGATPTAYKIYRDGVLIGTNGTTTKYTAAGLTAGTEYAFHVTACNIAGCSAESNALTIPTKPAAITAITAEPGNSQLTVTWDASVSPEVTGYRLWYKTSAASTWTEWTSGAADTSPTTVTGLSNGTGYVFKVATVNESGETESRSSAAFIPRTLPGVPVPSVTATTAASIAIAWPAPLDGGNKITGYQVYVDGVLNQTVTSTKATLTGLTSATIYTIRIKSCNASGCSNLSSALTQVTKPLVVTPVATRGDGETTVTWTPATGTVTAHNLYYKVATSPTWIEWTAGISDTSPTTITGLSNGVAYNFKVNVVNAAATLESRSASATPVGVPQTAPAQPGASSITTTGASISWIIPANTGGISANGFQIWVNGTLTSTTASSARTANLTGLTAGSTNTVQVKVCNTAGCSPASTTRSIVTLPVAATSLGVTPGAVNASVTWVPSTGNAVTAHHLYYKTTAAATWTEWTTGVSDTSPTTITGLTPNTAYSFKIQTVATSGNAETATVNATTDAPAVPDAPTNVNLTPGNAELAVTWIAPAFNGGAAISNYLVEYRTGSGSWVSAGTSATTSKTITGLTNGTAYQVRVSATNVTGYGSVSSSATSTPRTVPDAPTSVNLTPGNTELAVTWTAPASNGGSTISSYLVEYRIGSGIWTAAGTSNTTSSTITGLTNGTAYQVRISAYNDAGYSDPSSSATATPIDVPNAATSLSGTTGDTQIALTWANGATTAAAPRTSLSVKTCTNSGMTTGCSTDAAASSSATSFTKTGLTNGTAYYFQVLSTNGVGSSTSSVSAALTPASPLVTVTGIRDVSWTTGAAGTVVSEGACCSHIYDIAVDSSDKMLIVGNVTTWNGTPINRIFRLNADYTLDTTFNPGTGTNAEAGDIEMVAGGAYIAGSFSTYNGTQRNGLAKINTDGSLDTSFGDVWANSAESSRWLSVVDVAVDTDGKVYAAGYYYDTNYNLTHTVARYTSTGTFDSSWTMPNFGGSDSNLYGLTVDSSGRAYVAGAFTSVNGSARQGIVRLTTSGAVDSAFDSSSGVNTDGIVKSVRVNSDGVYIVGNFSSYGAANTSRSGIARLNTDGSLDTTFDPGDGFDYAWGVDQFEIDSSGEIYVFGYFSSYNSSSSSQGVVRINTDGSRDSGFANYAQNWWYGSAIDSSNNVYMVGQGNAVKRFSPTGTDTSAGSSAYPWPPRAMANWSVNGIGTMSDGKIYISGGFTTYDGVSRSRIARLNTDGSLDTTFEVGTGLNNVSYNLAVDSSDRVVVVGAFSTYNGTNRNLIVRINTDGSRDTTFNPGSISGSIQTVAIQPDGKILIGGSFTTVGGVSRTRIARLNTDGSLDTTFNPGTGFTDANNSTNGPQSIQVLSDGKILVGGRFSHFNGNPSRGVAILNSDGSFDTSFSANTGPGTGTPVVFKALAGADGKITVVGLFSTWNGVSRSGITRLNADGSTDSTFTVGTGFNSVWVRNAGLDASGKIYVVGDFDSYNGTNRSRIVRLNTNGTLDTGFDPGTSVSGLYGTLDGLFVDSSGRLLVGGNQSYYRGEVAAGIFRIAG